MTSKTSLFNKSIFFNHMRRLWWGSLLYFVLLVLMLPVQISMSDYSYYLENMRNNNLSFDSILYRSDISSLVLVLLIFVPTLVGLLLFRYLHVKKQAAMLHSLPVTRKSLYITTVISGLALQYIPIVLNGIILICYSAFGGYGSLMPLESVFLFIGMQLLFTAVLFSIAVFFGILTGNTILQVVFTYASYLLPIGACTAISYLLSLTLFGYQDDLSAFEPILTQVPIFKVQDGLRNRLDWTDILIQVGVAAVLYLAAYLFYRRRHAETAGDAISFEWLKPVFKYLVTFCVCLLALTYGAALKSEIGTTAVVLFLVGGILAYFGSEMLMRKTFKVFRRWKGLAVFLALLCVLGIGIHTDIMGYENYQPELSEIASASYGSDVINKALSDMGIQAEGEVTDPSAIQKILDVHRAIFENEIAVSDPKAGLADSSRLNYRRVNYRLKNGKIIARDYRLDETVIAETLKPLYSDMEYKKAYYDIFRNYSGKEFSGAELHHSNSYTLDSDTTKELYSLIQKDMETLGYEDISPSKKFVLLSITFMAPTKEEVSSSGEQKVYVVRNAQIDITPNFKHTLRYLTEKELLHKVTVYYDNVQKIIIETRTGERVEESSDPAVIERALTLYYTGEMTGYRYNDMPYRLVAEHEKGYRVTLGAWETASFPQ